jgi:hypothetical protein
MKIEKLVQFSLAVLLASGLGACSSTQSTQNTIADAALEMEYGSIQWPSSGLGSMLPDPNAISGKIYSDTDTKFTAYVSDYSQDEYEDYIESCKECGFVWDEWTTADRFRAYDEAGDKVVLSLDSDDAVMRIDVIVYPDEVMTKSESNSELEEKVTAFSADDFQEMMNDYEEFYTNYCNFMRSYSSSDSDESIEEKYQYYQNRKENLDEELVCLQNMELDEDKQQILNDSLSRIERLLELASE